MSIKILNRNKYNETMIPTERVSYVFLASFETTNKATKSISV
jgi:hypothetical protein